MAFQHARTHRKSPLNNQEGFTLIEIIAVLVILSILAVVAVPKYFDLQSEAQIKAVQGAMAEAIGRINGRFAKALLSGSQWNDIDYTIAESLGTDLGDFYIESIIANSSGDEPYIRLEVKGNTNTAVANAVLGRTIPFPGAP